MGRLCVCMYVCVFVPASAPTASVRPAAQSGGTVWEGFVCVCMCVCLSLLVPPLQALDLLHSQLGQCGKALCVYVCVCVCLC